ncbi:MULTISPECIES: NAD(P)-binding protein [unclassified Crossiella]|uniref:NAD(P)-binding protein n=1 Tax=unclassified Crossiella TaxID=2620835 RepID=UPI001FFEACEA|nr:MULTISPECIES: NAD(P)-binding protein [unclassified Crossiella]MCK2244582.1 FAD-dependent oxidoreductase [Crossiella sp. S99.2]MCK2258213.1 FAD-dependent oxidoreductase [Crossiella sp. S99.1]
MRAGELTPRLVVDGIADGPAPPTGFADTEETYDLVVAGAGIAGLAAAYFWLRDIQPGARILLLDPASQLGGHATRHEYTVDGHRLLATGGSQALTRPSTYPASARELLRELGINTDRFHEACDPRHYRRHGAGGLGVFFHREHWEHDHLAVLPPGTKWTDALATAPMPPEARRQLGELLDRCPDWLSGRDRAAKLAALRVRTCAQVLTDFADLHPAVHQFLLRATAVDSGLNFDQHPALDAALIGFPGLSGLRIGYDGDPWPGLSKTGRQFWYSEEAPIYRFPDGNATIARALARALIPTLAPAGTVDDLLSATLDLSQLDSPQQNVRIRLHSKVVEVRNTRSAVSLAHTAHGGHHRVTARAVILASWTAGLPAIVPELSTAQRSAAAATGRYPLAYANLALRDWKPWQRLGINRLTLPSGHWQRGALEFPVHIGDHHPSPDPEHPVLANFFGCFTNPGVPPAVGAAQGRHWLINHGPAELETSLLDTLTRILGPAGFNPDRDIAALTVNTWPHGYARYLTLPHDADRWPDGPVPGDLLAQGVGRIRIAGVDVANHPYLDGAVDTAHTAVHELARVAGPGSR